MIGSTETNRGNKSRERDSSIISDNIRSSPRGEPVIEKDVQSLQGKMGIKVSLHNYLEGKMDKD